MAGVGGQLRRGEPEILVNARFLAQRVTGVQRYAMEIVRALDRPALHALVERLGASLVLLAPKGVEDPGFDRLKLRHAGRLEGNPWVQLELPYHARGRVLWSPTNVGPMFHGRHVVTIHDASVLDHPEWFNPRFAAWYRLVLPQVARRALRVLTVSEFSRGRLVETLGLDPRRVSVVHNGVDPGFGPKDPQTVAPVRSRLGLPESYVLALGSLEPRKNTAGLLKAWALLLARRAVPEEVHLVIAGGRASVFREFDLPGLPERVVFAGYVEDPDLPALYSGAEAFVYPSLYEGFGLPVLEAMACGIPVVSSNNTSIPEVAGDAALLVDPRDVESLAGGIQQVLDDDGLRRTARTAGLERAKLFGWDGAARTVWGHLADAAGLEKGPEG
jgi:glycosyltransferase involved in cell wall biosynthesis